MLNASTAWRNSARISKRAVALVRLFYGDENKYITISSGDIEGFDEEFNERVLPGLSTTSGHDIFTHTFETGGITLRVSNDDNRVGGKFSDFVNTLGAGNDKGFENRDCEIRAWVPGMTTWNECLEFFVGVTRKIGQSATEVIFTIQDKRDIIHRAIGTLLTNADAADGKLLPQQALGKIAPKVYGDHAAHIGDIVAASTNLSYISNPTPCVFIGTDSDGNAEWLISSHVNNDFGRIWAFDRTPGRKVELVDQAAGATTVINRNGDTFYDFRFPVAINVPIQWDDSGNIIDQNTATKATASETVQAGTNNIDLRFPSNVIDLTDIDGIKLFVLADGDFDDVLAELYVDDDNSKNFTDPTETADFQPHAGEISDGSIDRVPLIFAKVEAGGTERTVDGYEAFQRIQYENTDELDLLFGGKGREYDESTAWIAARTGGATHPDNNGGGNVIQNPLGCVESLYRDELGRVDADIDEDAFNIAALAVTAMKFAFHISEVTESLQLIADMVRECRSYMLPQANGKIKVKTLLDEFTASDRSLDFNTLINPDFSQRTDPANLFTAVEVAYGDDGTGTKNQATGLSESSASQTKYNLSAAESTHTFESKFITDPTTAEALQAYLLAQWRNLHNLATFGIGVDGLDLETGDIIEFRNMPYDIMGEDITDNTITRAGQTINKYWWIYDVAKTMEGVTIKAMQLHKLD